MARRVGAAPRAENVTGATTDVANPRTSNMRAIRRTDTKPEVMLRSALHRAGYRFRKDLRLRAGDRWVRPDVVFPRRRVAVFVDGCFWHLCPEHGRQPAVNSAYWGPKLETNVLRDVAQTKALQDEGWTVVRVWEHEDINSALSQVAQELK